MKIFFLFSSFLMFIFLFSALFSFLFCLFRFVISICWLQFLLYHPCQKKHPYSSLTLWNTFLSFNFLFRFMFCVPCHVLWESRALLTSSTHSFPESIYDIFMSFCAAYQQTVLVALSYSNYSWFCGQWRRTWMWPALFQLDFCSCFSFFFLIAFVVFAFIILAKTEVWLEGASGV